MPHTHAALSGPERRVHVIQGEFQVTDDPSVVLTTILGSCVAACMRDPLAGVGGMNHFLVPTDDRAVAGPEALRYGVHSMELLVNGLLRMGASRDRLEAKLFGGARMLSGLTDIGSKNAEFAEQYLIREGIRMTGSSLRGDSARRLQFWPVSGRVRQMVVAKDVETVFVAERQKRIAPAAAAGALELF